MTATSRTSQATGKGAPARGHLMAIGGAEDKFKDKVILARFVELAGAERARITIVPTASSIEDAGERYKAIFLGMGVEDANIAFIADREGANNDRVVDLITTATGIFLTGGNQMRLSTIIGGTRASQAIRDRHLHGTVVAGTSAGASILSSHMVAFGSSGPTPRQRMAQMMAGFGLAPDMVIDQHFRQRDRVGRLLMFVASNPGLLGVGIDEDTAAVVHPDQVLEVLGRHSVTIVDGSHMYSDAHRVKGFGEITVSDAIFHVLSSGHFFDLATRKLIRPTG